MTLALSLLSSERTLTRPVRGALQAWSTRASCIVRLDNGEGVCGYGEASPLPGFSPDSLAECQSALAALDPSGVPARPHAGESLVSALGRASERLPGNTPAARCALEAALLDLWARAAGKPAWALLPGGTEKPAPRAVAALLMDDAEQAVEHAQRAYARGIRTFKLKIGRPGALARELSAVQQLRAELGVSAQLRLDANRSFSPAEASACLPRFAAQGLEFVEEPCALGELSPADFGVPLAFDESLYALTAQDEERVELQLQGARALVLKPTLLGGISGCVRWSRLAARIGAEVIVSHAFEGPLGLGLSAALALSIGSERAAQGLDLEGARLEGLPFFSGAHVSPWSAPGFGDHAGRP